MTPVNAGQLQPAAQRYVNSLDLFCSSKSEFVSLVPANAIHARNKPSQSGLHLECSLIRTQIQQDGFGTHALRVILGGKSALGEPQWGRLQLLEGLVPSVRTLRIAKDPECRGCSA